MLMACSAEGQIIPKNTQVLQFTVNGQTREALIYIPANAQNEPTPVIFAFHGHGGTMRNMYYTRRFDTLWTKAIFVCPQGLNTPGLLTDPEGKRSGWHMETDSSNIDLQFFDVMLRQLKTNYHIDPKRIYATGHSNGGGFTYLLWATRGDNFAAMAPTASAAGRLNTLLRPKPALHALGTKDPLVLPAMQRRTCDYVREMNQCAATGQAVAEYTTLYPSATGNPFILYEHPGGHTYPAAVNNIIIHFFQQQQRQ